MPVGAAKSMEVTPEPLSLLPRAPEPPATEAVRVWYGEAGWWAPRVGEGADPAPASRRWLEVDLLGLALGSSWPFLGWAGQGSVRRQI